MDPSKKLGKQLKLVSVQQRKWQPGLQDSCGDEPPRCAVGTELRDGIRAWNSVTAVANSGPLPLSAATVTHLNAAVMVH